MTSPRVEVDLGRIAANATSLVDRLGQRGISVVTKAFPDDGVRSRPTPGEGPAIRPR